MSRAWYAVVFTSAPSADHGVITVVIAALSALPYGVEYQVPGVRKVTIQKTISNQMTVRYLVTTAQYNTTR